MRRKRTISGGFPTRTLKPFPAPAMNEPPPELEARIAAFENAPPSPDFDTASWIWMILLGVALPLLLLVVGWWI
jgi:hypothetical protein